MNLKYINCIDWFPTQFVSPHAGIHNLLSHWAPNATNYIPMVSIPGCRTIDSVKLCAVGGGRRHARVAVAAGGVAAASGTWAPLTCQPRPITALSAPPASIKHILPPKHATFLLPSDILRVIWAAASLAVLLFFQSARKDVIDSWNPTFVVCWGSNKVAAVFWIYGSQQGE